MNKEKTDIRYLQHREINLKKWDNCIARSVNGIVYAFELDKKWFNKSTNKHNEINLLSSFLKESGQLLEISGSRKYYRLK